MYEPWKALRAHPSSLARTRHVKEKRFIANLGKENAEESAGPHRVSILTSDSEAHLPPGAQTATQDGEPTSSRKRPRTAAADSPVERNPLGSLSEIILGSTMSERVLRDYKELLGSVPGMTSAIAQMENDTQRAATTLRKQIASLVKTYRELNHVAVHAPLALGIDDDNPLHGKRPSWLPKRKPYDYDVVRAELEYPGIQVESGRRTSRSKVRVYVRFS